MEHPSLFVEAPVFTSKKELRRKVWIRQMAQQVEEEKRKVDMDLLTEEENKRLGYTL